jgi:threonine/homoserine/homoserine lactone efflux protein
VLPLVYFGKEVFGQWPSTAIALKIVAAGWVMFLAVKLWGRRGDVGGYAQVSAGRVYLTTLLNPKALVFGLILLPAPDGPQFLQKLGLFALMVMGAALIWGAAGKFSQTGSDGGRRLRWAQRIAAIWLAVVSATLLAGIVRA